MGLCWGRALWWKGFGDKSCLSHVQEARRKNKEGTWDKTYSSMACPHLLTSSNQAQPPSHFNNAIKLWIPQQINPLIRSEHSWFNHLPKATPLNIDALETKLSTHESLGDISYLNHNSPSSQNWSRSCCLLNTSEDTESLELHQHLETQPCFTQTANILENHYSLKRCYLAGLLRTQISGLSWSFRIWVKASTIFLISASRDSWSSPTFKATRHLNFGLLSIG